MAPWREGFDPEGDLCTAIQNTAMLRSAFAGELGVCRFLWEHGAASTIRTKNTLGWTPMWIACAKGYLDVAKWLFNVGGAEDIRTKNDGGCSYTPMFTACAKG